MRFGSITGQEKMKIRKSTQQDVNEILKIYDIAGNYMIAHGNATQWGKGYPGKDVLETDIFIYPGGRANLPADQERKVECL